MPSRSIKVLSVSDRTESHLFESRTIEGNQDINLILSCGDLPYYYIENLFQTYEVPVLFVRGNHDQAVEYSKKGPQFGPRGAIDLHKQVVVLNNLIFLGFEGSLPYREGPFMYSQAEMWQNVFSIIPKLLWNKLIYGRFVDVVLTHSPPRGIHDQDTNVHRGYYAFRWLLKTFKPAYMYHGHIHIYTKNQTSESIFEKTKVINTYGHRKSVIRAGKRHYPIQDSPFKLKPSLVNAAEDFRDARRRAALENIWSTLTGSSSHLIQFQQVEDQIQYEQSENLGLIDVPLDAIVGSVSRPNDFTRKFFPRGAVDPERWQRVKQGMNQQIRPIDLYQIDEVYFVLDGNHRVSIARQRGLTQIPAYVTKIESVVPLTPEDTFDDVIIKNQQVQFLHDTQLNMIRPELDFTVTTPGTYRQLREQINSHHLNLEMQLHYPFTYQEAVQSWVDEVYLPLVQIITQSGLLRDFPERTPTDLYLWLVNYQQELSHRFGWEIKPSSAIEGLAAAYGNRLIHRWKRLKDHLLPLSSSRPPPIGDWRKIHLVPRKEGQIFSAILVGLNGKDSGWQALEQAFTIALIENSAVRGLHVIKETFDPSDDQIREIRAEFRNRSGQYKVSAKLYLEQGEVITLLNQRARWNDLLVFSLEHPPEDKPAARLRSNLRSLIQTCPRPLLAVPSPSPMRHALLAYDGSPKATEALYLAAYLVEHWGIKLTVVTALEDSTSRHNPLTQAREYLTSHELKASIICEIGSPPDVILKTTRSQGCDFIIVGGYGYQPVMEVLFGSTLDALLRTSDIPILICH